MSERDYECPVCREYNNHEYWELSDRVERLEEAINAHREAIRKRGHDPADENLDSVDRKLYAALDASEGEK